MTSKSNSEHANSAWISSIFLSLILSCRADGALAETACKIVESSCAPSVVNISDGQISISQGCGPYALACE